MQADGIETDASILADGKLNASMLLATAPAAKTLVHSPSR